MKDYVVYRHIFPNGKSYIGITCAKPYIRRWRGGSSYAKQPKIWNAICKYGWENIKHEILFDNLSAEEANQKEQEMIQYYQSIENGYNISSGGGGTNGIPCSEETRKKISQANKGRSKGNPEHILAWVKAHGVWNKGKKLSPEHLAKITAERRSRCNKPIGAFDSKTGVLIAQYDSASDAARFCGVSKENISRCAHGGRKTSAGYVWRYLL